MSVDSKDGERRVRRASCSCGGLTATCTGKPVRVSVCHCLACQRRSGSAFAAQVRFASEDVAVAGESRSFVRRGDSGGAATFRFCPRCGTTVVFVADATPELSAIPLGVFETRDFPLPEYSVYEERKLPWVRIEGEGIEHLD